MPKRKPVRRGPPRTGSLSQPHIELLGDVQRCLDNLVAARTRAYERSGDLLAAGDPVRAKLALGSMEAQMYSRAVQVFAAMAVEAALNCYGLWHFGEDEFERFFGRMPTEQKLRELVELTQGVKLNASSEIVSVVNSLMAKRNAHVHSRAEESFPDAHGVFQPTTRLPQPARGDDAAIKAAEQVNRFFELFAAFAEMPMMMELIAPSASNER